MEQLALKLKALGSPLFLVYDKNVEEEAMRLGDLADIEGSLGLSVSEEVKTMDTVLSICRFLVDMNADRDAVVVAMGGGITTDMAAFAASIYKRGVRYVIVPTTLLAMVDAGIGGKTAVNLDGLKNMIGTFATPEFVYSSVEFTRTLSRRDIVGGAAEMLKTFLIGDAAKYEEAVEVFSEDEHPSMEKLKPLVEAAAAIKTAIVSRDPREGSERRKLNLGHTFAHAIEWKQASDPSVNLSHGEAVSIGIIEAAKLSERRGVAQKGLSEKLRKDFMACGLPVDLPYSLEELQEAMAKDKKNKGGEIRYVLIEKPGSVLI